MALVNANVIADEMNADDICGRLRVDGFEDNVTTLLDGPTFLLDIFFSWMSFLLQRRAVAKRPENRLGGPVPGRYYRLLSLDESEQRCAVGTGSRAGKPGICHPVANGSCGRA